MAKICLLQEAVNALLQQLGVFAQDLSVDEQIAPYFESHLCKISIRGKPICFGYKSWILASSYGYPLKFETYAGASEMRRDQSLGSCIVSSLLLNIENPRQLCVGFNNFFTFYQLLTGLKEKQF